MLYFSIENYNKRWYFDIPENTITTFLNKIEKQKEIYRNNYFGKDIKDNKIYNK